MTTYSFSHYILWMATKECLKDWNGATINWCLFMVMIFHTTKRSVTPFHVQNASWRACRKLNFQIDPITVLRTAIGLQGVNSLLPDPFTEVLQIYLSLSTRFNLPVKHFRTAPVFLRKWYFLTSCAHVVLQVRTQADWGGCSEEHTRPPRPKLVPFRA